MERLNDQTTFAERQEIRTLVSGTATVVLAAFGETDLSLLSAKLTILNGAATFVSAGVEHGIRHYRKQQ